MNRLQKMHGTAADGLRLAPAACGSFRLPVVRSISMSKPRDDLDFSLDSSLGENLLRKLLAQLRIAELEDDDLDWVSAAGDLAAEYGRDRDPMDEGGPDGRSQH